MMGQIFTANCSDLWNKTQLLCYWTLWYFIQTNWRQWFKQPICLFINISARTIGNWRVNNDENSTKYWFKNGNASNIYLGKGEMPKISHKFYVSLNSTDVNFLRCIVLSIIHAIAAWWFCLKRKYMRTLITKLARLKRNKTGKTSIWFALREW